MKTKYDNTFTQSNKRIRVESFGRVKKTYRKPTFSTVKIKSSLLILLWSTLIFSQQGKTNINPKVTLFGEGVISTQDFEFNATFTPNEGTVYFTKSSSNFALMSILSSTKLKNGTWERPKLVTFSGEFRDADPFISPNGKKLFFMSNRPLKAKEKSNGSANLWYVNNINNSWSSPKPVDFPNNAFLSVYYPSVASNGNLYFSAIEKESQEMHLYFSENKADKYQQPKKIPFSNKGDLDPIISADESFLVFASKSREGIGGMDLYISFNIKGMWSEPKVLPYPINTAFSEGQPGISSDNTYLYFGSKRTNFYSPQFWGFTREKKLKNYSDVQNELRSIDNGKGNIYYVNIKKLLKSLK